MRVEVVTFQQGLVCEENFVSIFGQASAYLISDCVIRLTVREKNLHSMITCRAGDASVKGGRPWPWSLFSAADGTANSGMFDSSHGMGH